MMPSWKGTEKVGTKMSKLYGIYCLNNILLACSWLIKSICRLNFMAFLPAQHVFQLTCRNPLRHGDKGHDLSGQSTGPYLDIHLIRSYHTARKF